MKHISLNFNSNQSKANTYLAVTGIVLSTTVLTIPTAHAARFAASEVVIYEGEPVDYSNRDDVIFIDDTSMYGDFSTVVSAPETNHNINRFSIQSKTVAKQTTPNYQPKQNKAIALAVKKRITPITQVKLTKPFDKPISNTRITNVEVENTKPDNKHENAELAAFYANALEFEKRGFLKKSTTSKTRPVRKTLVKNLVQKKPNEVQISLKMTKNKASGLASNESIPDKALNSNTKGKDPELVAFYMDVFAKQNNNLSNQTRSAKTLTVKQIPTKTIAQKRVVTKKKSNEVQLSLKTKTVKNPQLVAFYNQVFNKNAKNKPKRLSKQNHVIATSKAKDPELVAFYEREFGKGTNTPIMPKLKNQISSKVDVAAKTKSKKKSIAKKIAKKVKVKTKNSINTEIAAIEKLIGDLQAQKLI